MVAKNKKIGQGRLFALPEAQAQAQAVDWSTLQFAAENGDTFFLRTSKVNEQITAEVVMLGTQEACEAYTVEASIMNPDTKQVAFSAHFRPRPIMATNSTDDFCLTIKQESLAKIWRFNKEEKKFEFIVSAQIKI